MVRRKHAWSIPLLALLMAPRIVRAEAQAQQGNPAQPSRTVSAPPSQPSPLQAERLRVRVELERANAEVVSLKRSGNGLGDDYRIRARMADAEALARRLTTLDAQLGPATGNRTATPGAGPWPAAPEARPSDDRADLEAKADILVDQARRLNSQADVLAMRVSDLRGREELHRRAGQLERDPFSPLEQAKRRVATTSTSGATSGSSSDGSGRAAGAAGPGPTTVTTSTGTSAPSIDATKTAGGAGSSLIGQAPVPVPAGAGDSSSSVSAQFQGILDASTLAEIRRLEGPSSSKGNLQAMERALSALRARSAQLTATASTLRIQAKAAH
jgi:hypothetical protein